MDPIGLATVTSALVVLATECAKGVAGNASKDVWGKIKNLLGWQAEPKAPDLAQRIAAELEKDGNLGARIIDLLKEVPTLDSSAAALVGNIDATKVVVASRIDISGDFKM